MACMTHHPWLLLLPPLVACELPQLETVALWPDDEVMTLTWRAKLRCDRQVLEVERVSLGLDRMGGVAA